MAAAHATVAPLAARPAVAICRKVRVRLGSASFFLSRRNVGTHYPNPGVCVDRARALASIPRSRARD